MYLDKTQHLVRRDLAFQLALLHRNGNMIDKLYSRNLRELVTQSIRDCRSFHS